MGYHTVTNAIHTASAWPFVPVLAHLALAIALGIFVGLEREHSGKPGVRTFALTAILGCIGGLSGDLLTVLAVVFVALIVLLMNWNSASAGRKPPMTTSVALGVVGFCGVLCGQGHIFAPVTACVT